MSIIKASEAAYCRFRLPDLDKAERFLTDFGLVPAGIVDGRRYFRGTDPQPYCYVIEQGPERFLGFGLHAKSRADLDILAAATGGSVEPLDGPGGGVRVRVREPNGYDVDIVHGIETVDAIVITRPESNSVTRPLVRANELFRLRKGEPTPLRRLAHVVFSSPLVDETITWFADTLGFIASDDIVVGPERKKLASFMRVDDGAKHVDHHTLFVIKGPAGLHHVSFEVQDIDAVFHDHFYLKSRGYEHLWGIGRHLLGSQVYDYWSDPFGYTHEHWSDSDRLTADIPTNVHSPEEGLVSQWGEPVPARIRDGAKP